MTQGSDLIAAERQRQIDAEGYTAEQDAGKALELARAGWMYGQRGEIDIARLAIGAEPLGPVRMPAAFPWAERYWKPTGDPVRDLTKAGALIAAAIDSLLASRTPSDARSES